MTDIAYGRAPRSAPALAAATEGHDPLLERELGGPRRVRTGRRGRPRKVDYGFGRSTSVALPPEAAAAMAEANVAYVMRRYAEATTHLMDVVRQCPRAVEPYVTLGMVSEEQGRRDEAMNYYAIALTVGYRHLWRDPDLLSRLARLALLNLGAELDSQRAGLLTEEDTGDGPNGTTGGYDHIYDASGPSASTPENNSHTPFEITADLQLQHAPHTVPVRQMTPAERLYRRRWDAVHYLGRLARVLREPSLYWTRARLQAEGGNARHAIDGLAMVLAGQLAPGHDVNPEIADAAALDTIARISALGSRLGLPHAVGDTVAAALERALAGRRGGAQSSSAVLQCSRAVCAVLWSAAEGGQSARAVDLVGGLAALAAADATLGADWYAIGPDERRVRALRLLPPDARVMGHACAIMAQCSAPQRPLGDGPADLTGEMSNEDQQSRSLLDPGECVEENSSTEQIWPKDSAIFEALLEDPPADLLSGASTRAIVLYARSALYGRSDPRAALAALAPAVSRPSADYDDVEASILLAQAHFLLAREGGSHAEEHLRAAQMTLEAVLAVHPGRVDARSTLILVLEALGLPPVASLHSSSAPTTLFSTFPPLPGESRPLARATPHESCADTNAIFEDVWHWPPDSPPDALPLDCRLFTGVLGLRFRPTRTLVASVARSADEGSGTLGGTRRRTLRRRRRKVRRVEAVAVSNVARSRASTLLQTLGLSSDTHDTASIVQTVTAAIQSGDVDAIESASANLLECAPPRDALIAAAQVSGASHVRGVSPHVWFAALLARVLAASVSGRPAEAASDLWLRVGSPGEDAARLYTGGARERSSLLRLLHLHAARAAARTAGLSAAFSRIHSGVSVEAPVLCDHALASARWLARGLPDADSSAEVLLAALQHFMPPEAPAGHAFLRSVRRTASRGTVPLRYAYLAACLHADSPALAVGVAREMLPLEGAARHQAVSTALAGALIQMSMRRKQKAPNDSRIEALRLLYSEVEAATSNDDCDRLATAAYNYGRAAHAMGLFDLAAACYRRAMALPGAGATIPSAFNLAMVLLYVGQAECARSVLLSAIVF